MGDTTVDIAELEKQHAELGVQIVKLGGKVVAKAADDEEEEPVAKAKVERVKLDKGKKPAFLNETDDEDGEAASNPGKTKKAAEPDKVEKTETDKKVEKVEPKAEDDET